jgi:hypothetical protein
MSNRRVVPAFVSWLLSAVMVGVFSVWWFHRLWVPLHGELIFDDAYMFYRYAMHVRQGLGVSWNLDGMHTYGQTSPLWALIVLLLSYVPKNISAVLMLGSWVFSVFALTAMAWAVASDAVSRVMQQFWCVFPLVAVPVALTSTFSCHATTAMETMLAVTLGAVFLGLILGWQRGTVRAEFVGLVGLLLFLTRPESAVVVVLVPTLFFLFSRQTATKGSILVVLGWFFAGVALEMVTCKLYFHTALPLSYAMKSGYGYAGYAGNWHPFSVMFGFFSSYRIYLVVMALFVRRKEWKLVAACVLPALLTFAYLTTVTQIMGFHARFYVPYLPFFVVPSLLVIDRRAAEFGEAQAQWSVKKTLTHLVAALVVLVCCHGALPTMVGAAVDDREQAKKLAYGPVVLRTDAGSELPERPYLDVMWGLTNLVVNQLPEGSTVAASEVGYLGGHAIEVNIVDLAGLNDNEIAMHGFQMKSLLARKPDVIWMPHWDYTYQRGEMLSDPALLEQYDLYAGAANYGLAVRKETPNRAVLDRELPVLWKKLYPGYEMKDYLVRSASWPRQQHRLGSECSTMNRDC